MLPFPAGEQGGSILIELVKINGEPILINCGQIEYIELIPESKIIMMNGRYHIVKDSKDAIMAKVIEYQQTIRCGNRVEE